MGDAGGSLLGLQDAHVSRIRGLLSDARDVSAMGADELAGRTIANLFFEDSTRTRLSFTIAAQRLGARVVDLSGQGSSVSKGESITDTARTVEAMGVDALVVRTSEAGAAKLVSEHVGVPVINAGDGRHEHPTQALIDALTFAGATGRESDFDLSGLRVVIVGDVIASRVARSNIACLTKLGSSVVCCGPEAMAPESLRTLGCDVSHDLDEAAEGVDAVMMLRIQFERYGAGSPIASAREYRERFGLTRERARRLADRAWFMHPGPINRGLEIDGEVADGPRSLILRQVAAGPPVRMAALRSCVLGR